MFEFRLGCRFARSSVALSFCLSTLLVSSSSRAVRFTRTALTFDLARKSLVLPKRNHEYFFRNPLHQELIEEEVTVDTQHRAFHLPLSCFTRRLKTSIIWTLK